jgi:hypothetical protein
MNYKKIQFEREIIDVIRRSDTITTNIVSYNPIQAKHCEL